MPLKTQIAIISDQLRISAIREISGGDVFTSGHKKARRLAAGGPVCFKKYYLS